MQCPKDKTVTLVDGFLSGNLAVKHCPDCEGSWISAQEYQSWQTHQSQQIIESDSQTENTELNFVGSPFDTKAHRWR